MLVTEKDLVKYEPWKKIQQNMFIHWYNEHLKCVNKCIRNLQTDLTDKLWLIELLKVLIQKHRHHKSHQQPTFQQMKLENVLVVLEFLGHERIKFVSIDSEVIVDGNLKLILGLLWTLILHYSISMCSTHVMKPQETTKEPVSDASTRRSFYCQVQTWATTQLMEKNVVAAVGPMVGELLKGKNTGWELHALVS